MKEVLLVSNDLVELSNDINVITAEINAYQRVAGEAIFEIGRRLSIVRDTPERYGFNGFRDWEIWCTETLNITRRQANKYVRVYRKFDGKKISGKSTSRFSLDALNILTSVDDEDQERPHTIPSTGETKTVDEMTVRELREVKKALRQAEEDKQILGQLLTEERNKTPEVQYVKDTESEEQLRLYRERYGDISENVYRITNETEISGMVMEFSEHTRDFIKQYAFLKHYEGTI
ncbi:hypothetical protein COJ14_25360 [Bacillus cereus]|nr:hypothetical protein COJ14_25360 [Bacillus cereus]